jgi:hypothetical protein
VTAGEKTRVVLQQTVKQRPEDSKTEAILDSAPTFEMKLPALPKLQSLDAHVKSKHMKDPVQSLFDTLSPEVKDALVKRCLAQMLSAPEDSNNSQFDETAHRVQQPSLSSILENCVEFKRGKQPLALLAPITSAGLADGSAVPLFDYSFAVGTSPVSMLRLNELRNRTCQFVSSLHAEILFVRVSVFVS